MRQELEEEEAALWAQQLVIAKEEGERARVRYVPRTLPQLSHSVLSDEIAVTRQGFIDSIMIWAVATMVARTHAAPHIYARLLLIHATCFVFVLVLLE